MTSVQWREAKMRATTASWTYQKRWYARFQSTLFHPVEIPSQYWTRLQIWKLELLTYYADPGALAIVCSRCHGTSLSSPQDCHHTRKVEKCGFARLERNISYPSRVPSLPTHFFNSLWRRFWRRILMHTVEWEPGLRDFLPDFSSLERQVWRILKIKKHISVRRFDPNPLARRWVKNSLVREILSLTSSCWSSWKSGWTMSGCRRTRQQFPGENYFFNRENEQQDLFRTSHVFGELEEQHFLYHIMSTGFNI